jgi:RNA polymerase sigma factor (sigma-70 family)
LDNNNYLDSLILKALREDDERALNHLFEHFYNRLFRIGVRTGANYQVVEEAILSVYLDMWKYRHSIGEIISLEAYLTSSVKKKLATANQKNKPLNFDNTNFPVSSYEEILILQQTSDEIRQKILKTLELLTERQKQIVVMKYFDEMSYEDISASTGLQKESLYKIMTEALKKLKTILSTR